MVEYNIIVEKGEDGYLISEVIGLPGCHTQAKTMKELIERTKEAILVYLESFPEEEITTSFVGVKKIEV